MMPAAEQIIFSQEDWRVLDSLQLRNLSALKGICDEMSKEIIRELSDGINAGEGMPKLSARIQKATGMGKTRADLMARTETINAAVDGCRVRYEQAGIKEFEYLAASDARTCEQCASHNGKIYKLTDNANLPPLHPNCRCAIAPVVGSRKKEIQQAKKPPAKSRKTKPSSQKYTIEQTLKSGTPQYKETKEALEAANNWDDLSKAMQNRYGHKIATSDYLVQHMRFEEIKESIVAADKVFEDIPEMTDQLKALGDFADRGSYARAYPDRIEFGTHYRKTSSRKELQKALDDDYISHFHPTPKIESTYIHELGHIAEAAVLVKKRGELVVWEWNAHTQAKDIVREATIKVERDAINDSSWEPQTKAEENEVLSRHRSSISHYAMKSYAETMAEAFADYYINGEDATDLSKEIVRIIKERLRQK